jgi:hypothetical protein
MKDFIFFSRKNFLPLKSASVKLEDFISHLTQVISDTDSSAGIRVQALNKLILVLQQNATVIHEMIDQENVSPILQKLVSTFFLIQHLISDVFSGSLLTSFFIARFLPCSKELRTTT